MLRNKVEYSAQKHHHKVVLVTSALAGEGKSTVAVNLAISLAQSGKKDRPGGLRPAASPPAEKFSDRSREWAFGNFWKRKRRSKRYS